MFIYNNKEYEKVWFTSDEHYGSDRHILLSGRLDFQEVTKEKQIREFAKKLDTADNISEQTKTAMIRNLRDSVYGTSTGFSRIDRMNDEIMYHHNVRVSNNDIVFHLGDFGDYKFSKYLNGDHILILGNYEEKDIAEKFNNDINAFSTLLTTEYGFIDVLERYVIDTQSIFGGYLTKDVGKIFMTHKPSDCIFDHSQKQYINCDDGRLVMNFFGHIHDKCKVKQFGLNVGIDCHHYYPVSQDEVDFYLNAILHHYDDEVFI